MKTRQQGKCRNRPSGLPARLSACDAQAGSAQAGLSFLRTGLKTCFYVGLVHLSMFAGQSFAQTARLDMVTGTTFTLNSGASFDISGSILSTGTISTAGDILLNGDLNMSGGSFSATGGTVTFRDNTQSSTIYGSNTFNNVTSTTANKTLNFRTTTTQTVSGTLTLTGGGVLSTQTIKLQCSGGAGAGCWNLSVSAAAHSVSYVAVQDSEITGSNDLTASDSINSGNNDDAAPTPHWVFSPHASGTIGNTATSIADSGTDDVVRIRVTNLSNDASSVIRLDSVNIKFMDSGGTALTTAEAKNLFSALKIYCDDDTNGVYGAGDSTVVSNVPSASIILASGYQTFTVSDNACVRTGATGTYKDVFLVATLNSNATSQAKNAFKVYIKPDTPSSDMTMTNTYISSAVTSISGTATTSKTAKAAYWIFTLSNPIYTSPIIRSIGGTNKVFIGSGDDVAETDGKLYRLDLTTGATDWNYPAGNTAGIRTTPAAFKDPSSSITYVYFATENGKLYAVDETGAQRFAPVTVGGLGNAIRSSPSLRGYITAWCPTCIGVFVADGSANASVWAYDADDGDDGVGGPERWSSAATGSSILSQPFVNNNEVYIGAEDGTIYKIATADGSALSSNTSCSGNQARGGGYSLSSKLWFGCTNNNVYEFNTADLTTPNPGWPYNSGSPIESMIFERFGFVYFGNNAGNLYKINELTQLPVAGWPYTAGGAIKSFPLKIGVNVYFTADDGYLYTLLDATSSIRANFPASLGTGTVTVNPAVAIAGGRIVVSVTEGTTGKVFCFPDN